MACETALNAEIGHPRKMRLHLRIVNDTFASLTIHLISRLSQYCIKSQLQKRSVVLRLTA